MTTLYADLWDADGGRHRHNVRQVAVHVVDPQEVSAVERVVPAGVLVRLGGASLVLSDVAAVRLAEVLADAVRSAREVDL